MQESSIKNIKLGLFVMTGLLLLIGLLYLIGVNRNIFGAHFELKATFKHVNGLEVGNNVRFAGINAGTVDAIEMINDSTVEVTMLLNNKYKGVIKINAEAAISTDGLVGNKIINIVAHHGIASIAKNADYISTGKSTDTEEMLHTLSESNKNIRKISDTLLLLVSTIKNSTNLNYLFNDPAFSKNINNSILLIKNSMIHLNKSSLEIEKILASLNQGKGNMGKLLKDTALYTDIDNSIQSIQYTSENLSELIDSTQNTIELIQLKLNDNNNSIGKLMNDTTMSNDLKEAIFHINQSALHFDEILLALQHSFLLRHYFKKENKAGNKNH